MVDIKAINRGILALCVLLTLSACGAMRSAGPEDANKVINLAGQYKQGGINSLRPTAQSRKPLKPGQWVATLARSKSDPNEVTLQVMKVAAVSGSRVTLEMEQYSSQNGGERMVMQQTVSNFPVNAKTAYSGKDAEKMLESMEIESIRVMDEKGEVATVPQLPFGVGGAASEILKSTVATADIKTEPCATQSFKSTKCIVVPFESQVLWMSDKGKTYAHSDVPVLGFLSSESSKYNIETIGFGDKGAKILIR